MSDSVGVVAIGRNEGERLVRCLSSLSGQVNTVIYVDSGSTDGSVERARDLGARVVELDRSRPFTAARARNVGFERLDATVAQLELVQFVDADCEMQPGWMEVAVEYLRQHPDVAVVCGRRRERHPGASVYHRLTDMEWDMPVGETHSCGGDALIRAKAFREVGGYNASMIAGEDPEFCVRIRRAGYRITRLDREMTLHDVAMLRFGQWWRRQARSGHAYAEIVYCQGRRPERYWVRRLTSILAWGGGLPALSLIAAWPTSGLSLSLLGAYAILWIRVYRARRQHGANPGATALYASACMVGKLAEFQGVLSFAWNRVVRRRTRALIEYKRAERVEQASSGSGAPRPRE